MPWNALVHSMQSPSPNALTHLIWGIGADAGSVSSAPSGSSAGRIDLATKASSTEPTPSPASPSAAHPGARPIMRIAPAIVVADRIIDEMRVLNRSIRLLLAKGGV